MARGLCITAEIKYLYLKCVAESVATFRHNFKKLNDYERQ